MNHSLNISDAAFRLETPIALPADEVHVWRVELAQVAPVEQRWEPILSADERTRAARFHFTKDRQRYTATRALLRMILGGYVNSDPKELVFRYSKNGKPWLNCGPDGNVEFNVSHSGQVALLAFTQRRATGVDVEHIRENFDHEAIAGRFFSRQERQQLALLPPAERYRGFFRCWTRKEAYIKAEGTGLSLPLHQFDVSLGAEESSLLLATRPDPAEAARWTLREIPAGDGYVAALCVQGTGWRIKF
ncbi:MAG TPA: 4'-phosphopantetheinyl transferase superfamily protein [Candidatus Sulfotelmatobacter sp.]|nr:4'-phosphopantetheinyl transferase superfamily protein [Candidatus Sulfotelmatobacter sp.]